MASPIAGAGHVFFIDTSGRTTLIQADPQMEIAAVNELGQEVFASPAAADRRIFIRKMRNLYCMGL
jgi:hypothetical protein